MSWGGSGSSGPTAQEQALQRVSLEQAKDFDERIKPVEDELIRRSTSTEGDKTRARGLARTDAATAAAGRDQALVAKLGSEGTRSVAARGGLAAAEGSTIGRSLGGAEAALKKRDMGQKFNIAAQARSQQGKEMEGLSSAVNRTVSNQVQSMDRALDRFSTVAETISKGMGAGYERNQQLKEIERFNESERAKAAKTPGYVPNIQDVPTGLGRVGDILTAQFHPNKYASFFEMQRAYGGGKP